MSRSRRHRMRWFGSTCGFQPHGTDYSGKRTEPREYVGARRGKEGLLTEATTKLGLCQVRSETGHPCHRLAVVKLRGIPFCEWCACQQEAYFAIGEMTQEL